jgi:peptide chain release factor subunit 1
VQAEEVASVVVDSGEVTVLDQGSIDRLRETPTGGFPVLSLYVNLEPSPESLRTVPARIKDLLAQADEESATWPRAQRISIRADIQSLLSDVGRFGSDLGRSVAVFRSDGAGIDEQLTLPGPVRDRAVIDTVAYLRPLEAMVEHYQRFCVAVVGRRFASIFRFLMGELETWEEMRDEEVRKANFGGFSGYDEQRVRARSDEVVARHYRHVGSRLADLRRSDGGFDLLILGGSDAHIAGALEELPPDVSEVLAGSFTIDPGTMTPATVLAHATDVAKVWESENDQQLVAELFDTAASGGAAVLGLEGVCIAANRRAVDVLFVQVGHAVPGSTCTECGWVSCRMESDCSVCGSVLSRVPDLVDRLGESVRSAGGTVRHILSEGPLAEVEVGARLRYSIPMVDPT